MEEIVFSALPGELSVASRPDFANPILSSTSEICATPTDKPRLSFLDAKAGALHSRSSHGSRHPIALTQSYFPSSSAHLLMCTYSRPRAPLDESTSRCFQFPTLFRQFPLHAKHFNIFVTSAMQVILHRLIGSARISNEHWKFLFNNTVKTRANIRIQLRDPP